LASIRSVSEARDDREGKILPGAHDFQAEHYEAKLPSKEFRKENVEAKLPGKNPV
jgi:hypothetical protein